LDKESVQLMESTTKVTRGVDTGIECISFGVLEKLPMEAVPEDQRIPPYFDAKLPDGKTIRIATDVFKCGFLYDYGVCGGSKIRTNQGTLGANIEHKDKMRLVSCAHVLTKYQDALVGTPVVLYKQDGDESAGEAPTIGGHHPVTYYVEGQQPPKATRATNTIDFAWADYTTVPDTFPELAKTIFGIGAVTGGTREPITNEKVSCFGQVTKLMKGSIKDADVDFKTFRTYNDQKYVSYWKFCHRISFAGKVPTHGDSGAAVVASDKKTVGLLKGGNNHDVFVLTPFPDNWA